MKGDQHRNPINSASETIENLLQKNLNEVSSKNQLELDLNQSRAIINQDYDNPKINCHYARILVDVDLTNKLPKEVMMEREGFTFFVGIEYEILPYCCSFCKIIGHSLDNCK